MQLPITILYICSGSVYYYTLTGSYWSYQSKILATDGASNDYFGRSVSIFNNGAFIGAHYDDDKGTNSGIDINIICAVVNDVYSLTYKCIFRFCILLHFDWIILELSI
jgi:hypothetical protein